MDLYLREGANRSSLRRPPTTTQYHIIEVNIYRPNPGSNLYSCVNHVVLTLCLQRE